jgi:hypothetical protein
MYLLIESMGQKWHSCLPYTHTISKFTESVILRESGYIPYGNNHGDIFIFSRSLPNKHRFIANGIIHNAMLRLVPC